MWSLMFTPSGPRDIATAHRQPPCCSKVQKAFARCWIYLQTERSREQVTTSVSVHNALAPGNFHYLTRTYTCARSLYLRGPAGSWSVLPAARLLCGIDMWYPRSAETSHPEPPTEPGTVQEIRLHKLHQAGNEMKNSKLMIWKHH